MQYSLGGYILLIHGNKLSGLHNTLVLIESYTSLSLQSSDEDSLCRQHEKHWNEKSQQVRRQGAAQAGGSLGMGTGTVWSSDRAQCLPAWADPSPQPRALPWGPKQVKAGPAQQGPFPSTAGLWGAADSPAGGWWPWGAELGSWAVGRVGTARTGGAYRAMAL